MSNKMYIVTIDGNKIYTNDLHSMLLAATSAFVEGRSIELDIQYENHVDDYENRVDDGLVNMLADRGLIQRKRKYKFSGKYSKSNKSSKSTKTKRKARIPVSTKDAVVILSEYVKLQDKGYTFDTIDAELLGKKLSKKLKERTMNGCYMLAYRFLKNEYNPSTRKAFDEAAKILTEGEKVSRS